MPVEAVGGKHEPDGKKPGNSIISESQHAYTRTTLTETMKRSKTLHTPCIFIPAHMTRLSHKHTLLWGRAQFIERSQDGIVSNSQATDETFPIQLYQSY